MITNNKESLLENMYTKYKAALMDMGIEAHIIRAEGGVHAKIVFVGEAPGATEERELKPFVGRAGKNLDAFLQTLEIPRDTVYVTNAVKFRPKKPGKRGTAVNRTPTRAEIQLCAPFLFEEMKIISPKIIITLGGTALYALTGDADMNIGGFHGKLLNLSNLTLFPLYHPASIMYNQELKAVYDADLEILKNELLHINSGN